MIYSSSWRDHVQQPEAMFSRQRDANLKLNLAKYESGQIVGKSCGSRTSLNCEFKS